MALVIAFAIYFGPQLLKCHQLRERSRNVALPPRGWGVSPKPLTDTTVSIPVATISILGLRFQVPWKDIVSGPHGEWFECVSRDGHVVRFYAPTYTSALSVRLDGRLIGYSEFKATMSITPNGVSPFSSHRRFAQDIARLGLKGTWFEHNVAVPDIFSVSTQKFRGFEVSGLARGWQWGSLTLFDSSDDRYDLALSVRSDSTATIRQSDVNLVITSFVRGY
jgi:hypothetical protein